MVVAERDGSLARSSVSQQSFASMQKILGHAYLNALGQPGELSTSSGTSSLVVDLNSSDEGLLTYEQFGLGLNAKAMGRQSYAIGSQSQAVGDESVAIGYQSVSGTLGSHSIAVGSGSSALAAQSTALGPSSRALHEQSTAVGAFAQTTRANQVVPRSAFSRGDRPKSPGG